MFTEGSAMAASQSRQDLEHFLLQLSAPSTRKRASTQADRSTMSTGRGSGNIEPFSSLHDESANRDRQTRKNQVGDADEDRDSASSMAGSESR